MLTNKEVLILGRQAQQKAKKSKLAHVQKDLCLQDQVKKAFCRIIVSYLVRNKSTSIELSKKLKIYKNSLQRVSLYQYNLFSLEFVINACEKLSKIDPISKSELNKVMNSLKNK